jgi:phosphoribosylamine--glycine ligase
MRVLIIDQFGMSVDMAVRMQDQGHKVKAFIPKDEKLSSIGKGMIDVVRDYEPWFKWADVIVNTDNNKYVRDLEWAKAAGVPVVSANRESADWELVRGTGMAIMRRAGIKIPPCQTFTDYDRAIAHVKKTGKRYVSKPDGDADKALSYCSKSPADMVYMLERWKKIATKKAPFILQEFIGGTEMAVGGWFGPGGFNEGWCENWEFKKLMNDEKGVATGEQGTVLRYVRDSKLARLVLQPVEDMLASVGYVGYVDVNCIIDESGTPWPLEFTMRFGWPTFNIQLALHDGDIAEWLLGLAEGKDTRPCRMNEIAIGVVVTIPDYPYSHATKKEVTGVPVYGIDTRLRPHVHPAMMMLADAPNDVDDQVISMPTPQTAGDYVLIMTATGQEISACRRTVYNRLERLSIPNSPMYRTDIGRRLRTQLPLIQRHGFAKGMKY